jgi:adenosylhomocysteine nucleosidase
MGGINARISLEYVCAKFNPELIVSAGFGGALYDGAAIGEVIWGSKVLLIREGIVETLDLSTAGNIFGALGTVSAIREGNILTLDRWMKKSEIRKILNPQLSFPVCDMEAFFLAEPCLKKGLPFVALRAVSDRADEDIPPEFLTVSDESGRYRLSRALRLFLKPGLIKDIVKIGRNSAIASDKLWAAVRSLIEAV